LAALYTYVKGLLPAVGVACVGAAPKLKDSGRLRES
jgi:hypothetical protein